MRRLPTLLAGMGDVTDVKVTSGTPFHLLRAGRAAGLLDGPVPTSQRTPDYRGARAAWSAARLARGRSVGGFAVSAAGVDAMWLRARPPRPGRVVNCYQLYPERLVHDPRVRKWFFVDQTLTQLLDHYDYGRRVAPDLAARAIARERAGYAAAEGIIVHSRWAAASVVDGYGIDPARIHVVPQAANLDPALVEAWAARPPADPYRAGARPLRLVFVGVEWHRKGLDRLVRGLAAARARGVDATLTVVGCDPASVPAHLRSVAGTTWVGYVDKRWDQERFVELIGGHDVGCLLSRHEAGGVSLREFHALGLAVLGTRAGGSAEQTLPDASILLAPEAGIEEVADQIARLAADDALVARLREASRAQRATVTWEATVAAIRAFWPTDP